MRCKALLTVLLALLWTGLAHASATDIYITNTGSSSGVCTVSVQTPAFFNNAANWGAGAGQIGPDTIAHLCGTITGISGATGLTFQTSGTSGHPIILKFEAGAKMDSPKWATAIRGNAKNWITIDGGTNGIVENTLAGSSGATCLAGACSINGSPTLATIGVDISGSSNVEVKNLTIQKIYVRVYGGGDGDGSNGIFAAAGTQTGVKIHDNHVSDSHANIDLEYGALSDAEVYGNVVANSVWGIVIKDDDQNTSATNVRVHDNDVSGFEIWGGVGGFHQDAIFFAATNPGTTLTNSKIYNNYLHGPMTNPSTGPIYLTGTSGGMNTIDMFGNLIVAPHNTHGQAFDDMEGCIVIGFGAHAGKVVNNTCVADHTPLIDMRDTNQSNVTLFKNNIGIGFSSGVPMYEFVNNKNDTSVSGGIWNNNQYMYAIATHLFAINDGGTNYTTIAAWTAHCGCDGASFISDPLLNATTFVPAAGSPAIGAGVNLSGLGIPELLVDRNGVARGAGAWTIGALAAGGVTPPPPPGPPPVLFSQAILNVLPAPATLPAPTLAKLTPSSTYRGVNGFSQDGKVWNASLTVTATGANLCATCFTYDGVPVMTSCMSPNACTLLLSTASVPVPTVLTAHVIAVAMPTIAVPVLQ